MVLGYYDEVSFFLKDNCPESERQYPGYLACGDGYATNTCKKFRAS